MVEVTVFAAAFLGSLIGVLTGVLPVLYLVKKKWEESGLGAMFG